MAIKNITVEFPLKKGPDGTYQLISESSPEEAIKFNLKNLLLTIPGERIDPNFGVGLIRYLFLNNNEDLKPLKFNIREQIKRYMNFFSLLEIETAVSTAEPRSLKVKLRFEIDSMKLSDELEIEVSV